MSKRSLEDTICSDLKRMRFETTQGTKRGREHTDEDDEYDEMRFVRPQTFHTTSGHHMLLQEMRAENTRLREEADKKDRLIHYGASEIKRLNADLLISKRQVQMMEDYVAGVEGRTEYMPFYVS